MKIRGYLLNTLPALAWGVNLVRGASELQLVHGSSVVVGEDYFAEGAWSGSLDTKGFSTAAYVFGSGGWLAAERVRFRTPSHTLERVWVVIDEGAIWVSNSLPMVLAMASTGLSDSYPFYEADFLSFMQGSGGIVNPIPLSNRSRLYQYVDGVVEFDKNLNPGFEGRGEGQVFASYGQYRDHLTQTAMNVCGNAADRARSKSYSPLATVSRGYDSPACAVVAKECGATHGLTFSEARAGYSDSVDDGCQIGAELGFEMTAYRRNAYKSGDGMAEKQFLASGGGGEDVILAAAGESLPGSVLFTGFLGDTLWGLSGDFRRSALGRISFPGGGSISEYRLNADFVHVPLPIMDLHSHESILAISWADEMRPWKTNSPYDRPIPRRIAESAGIPRDWFGVHKMAVTEPMYYQRPAEDVLGSSALQQFDRYLAVAMPKMRTPINRLRILGERVKYTVCQRLSWRADAAPEALKSALQSLSPNLSHRGRRDLTETSLLVQWAVHDLVSDYALKLRVHGC